MEKCQAGAQRRQCWNAVTTTRRTWFSFNAIKNHELCINSNVVFKQQKRVVIQKVGGCLKEPLRNIDEFWQRQVLKLEALVLKHSHSMVQTNKEEIENLAKPGRVSLLGIISVVAFLVKAISILCKVRLESDAQDTYRISPMLLRGS